MFKKRMWLAELQSFRASNYLCYLSLLKMAAGTHTHTHTEEVWRSCSGLSDSYIYLRFERFENKPENEGFC